MKGIERLLEIIVEKDGMVDTCEEVQRNILKKYGLDCNKVNCSTCQLFTLAWVSEHRLEDLEIIKNPVSKYVLDVAKFRNMEIGITCSKYEDFISFKHIMKNMGFYVDEMRDEEWYKDVIYVGYRNFIMAWDDGYKNASIMAGLGDPFEDLEIVDYKDMEFLEDC